MSYRKGYKFEREVKLFLENEGFYVIRSAGSKKPDIIAGKNGKVLVMECKYTSKSAVYLDKEEVENLKRVAMHFNAEPVILIKKKYKGFIIFPVEELKEIGKSYVAKLDDLS